jgi:hypothetical protein
MPSFFHVEINASSNGYTCWRTQARVVTSPNPLASRPRKNTVATSDASE